MGPSHEAEIDAHVPVQDVTQLVGDEALQFVAVEANDRFLCDPNDGVVGSKSCRKRVNAHFWEHVDGGSGDAGRYGHFFHHVEQLTMRARRAGRIQLRPAEPLGHDVAAFHQLSQLERPRPVNERECCGRDTDQYPGTQPHDRLTAVG